MLTPATHSTQSQDRSRQIVWRGRGIATSDGAGVKLTRVIGTHALPDLDPFLMLDEFGSDDPKAYIAGFPDHPHRGFETVTYMLDGRMRHRDSAGNEGLLGPGSVQWMTAARGLVHSEMPEQEHGLMRGFQLWVNLPAADKMGTPRYQDIPPENLPTFDHGKVRGKVIAGEFQGLSSPVERGATAPLYLDLTLDAGGRVSVPLPDDHNAFVYVFDGALDIGGQRISKGEIGVLSLGDSVTLDASAQSGRVLVIAGKPLREPVVKYGPFVMNTRQEIEQAVADFQAGRLQ
jgi:redox-sensitive bicupin YhaK (pirin superfamily)